MVKSRLSRDLENVAEDLYRELIDPTEPVSAVPDSRAGCVERVVDTVADQLNLLEFCIVRAILVPGFLTYRTSGQPNMNEVPESDVTHHFSADYKASTPLANPSISAALIEALEVWECKFRMAYITMHQNGNCTHQ